MLKNLAVFMAIVMMFVSVQSAGAQGKSYVTLKAGTPVMLELLSHVNSNRCHAGDMVDFRVSQDVKVNGKVVIAAGAIARGQVTYAQKNNFFGTPGEVSVVVRSVTTVDGTQIPLTSTSLSNEGNDKLAASIVVTIFCLLGFIIKGGKGELIPGTQLHAIVTADVEIENN